MSLLLRNLPRGDPDVPTDGAADNTSNKESDIVLESMLDGKGDSISSALRCCRLEDMAHLLWKSNIHSSNTPIRLLN